MSEKHTISILVNDQPGVLARVANLFGQRGFNIESITVGQSEEKGLSRMIITTSGNDQTVQQIMKQLHKLIDVIKVQHLSANPMVARELVLIKVEANPQNRSEIGGIVEPFRASIVDVGTHSLMIQATGDSEKIDAMIDLLRPYGIRQLCRTGVTAMSRGAVTARV